MHIFIKYKFQNNLASVCSLDIKKDIMRKTASYRVSRLSTFCTDPAEAESKMREAIGWGLELTKRRVRMIKLERLLRCSVGTGKVEKLAKKLALEARGGRRGPVEERDRNITLVVENTGGRPINRS